MVGDMMDKVIKSNRPSICRENMVGDMMEKVIKSNLSDRQKNFV